ncbi:MAG TPA: replication protein RepA [Amycolatopsis sp.]|nr:replication protein RepA [Amycolatopsis sp.]
MPPTKGRPRNTDHVRAQRIAELQLRNNDGSEPLAFNPAPLTMASLPYRQPKAGTELWVRRDGDFHLTVSPGVRYNPKDGTTSRYGFPFGVVPRALLMWVTAEAVRTKNPVIMLGDSLADFVFKVLGQRATGGRNGTATRVKEQATRLFNANITYQWNGNGDRHQAGVNLNLARAWDMDLGDGEPGQGSLFPSFVQLGADFFNEIVERPVPLDLGIVRHLGSAAEIDFYAFLTYKMFSLQRPYLHKWENFGGQFGYQFANTPKGRYKLKEATIAALKNVLAVYPANVEITADGLQMSPGFTSVPLKGTRELRAALEAGKQGAAIE